MINTEQLRKLIEDKKVTIGATATLTAIRSGSVSRVVLAQNASPQVKAQIERLATSGAVSVDELSVPNDELGVMCKKPFSISLLGIK